MAWAGFCDAVLRGLLPDDRRWLPGVARRPRDVRGRPRRSAPWRWVAQRADRLRRRPRSSDSGRRPGGRFELLGHARQHPRALHAGVRADACWCWPAWPLHLRPHFAVRGLAGRRAARARRSLVGVLACAGPLSPVLYGLGERIVDGRFVSPPTLWRSSPRGVDLLALVDVQSESSARAGDRRSSARAMARRSSSTRRRSAWSRSLRDRVRGLARRLSARAPGWVAADRAASPRCRSGPFIHVAGVNTYVPGPWALLRYRPDHRRRRARRRGSRSSPRSASRSCWQARWPRSADAIPQRRRLIAVTGGVLLLFELLPAPRTLYSAEIPSVYEIIAADPRPVRILAAALRRPRRHLRRPATSARATCISRRCTASG